MKKNQMRSRKWKIWSGIVLWILVFCIPLVFADGGVYSACTKWTTKLIHQFYEIYDKLSRIWVIMVKLAWKLMTNGLIYWEAFKLDSYLWKIWQMIRNLVNFAIGFYFLYCILRYILSPSKDIVPQKIIKQSLIGGVLIQMSWFIVMILVDLSTILTATVASLPQQVVAQSQNLQTTLKVINQNNLFAGLSGKVMVCDLWENNFRKNCKKVDRDASSGTGVDDQMLFDMMWPKSDDLSGPLMWLGFSVFRIQNALDEDNREYKGVSCVDKVFKEVFQFAVWGVWVLLFGLSLVVLMITLVVRLAYLRIVVALSPLVVFLRSFKDSAGFKWLSKSLDILSPERIFKIIFHPVYYCLLISLMFIVILILQSFLKVQNSSNFSNGEVGNGLYIETTEIDRANQRYNSTMNIDGLISLDLKDAKITIQDVLLMIISLALMRMLVKAALTQKTWIGKLDQLNESIVNVAQTTLESTPIIPTRTGSLAIWDIYSADSNSSALFNQLEQKYGGRLEEKRQQQNQNLESLLGIKQEKYWLDDIHRRSLKQISDGRTLKDLKEKVAEVRKTVHLWFHDIADEYLYPMLGRISDASIREALNINVAWSGKDAKAIKESLQGESGRARFKALYEYVMDDTIDTTFDNYNKKSDSEKRLPLNI